ncbi:MAG: ferritin-like domain-containing protein [Kiloniellales bacterium]|nr:ferritin-like domain-containing protein [Kiloniellales bacterium]
MAPAETWRSLVRRHFKGTLKPPFNDDARAKAGLTAAFYEDL